MIRQLLERQPQPERLALIEGGRKVRYAELISRARAIAVHLPKPCGCVAILLPSGTDYIAACWGALYAGAVVLPLNTQLGAAEVQPLLIAAGVHTAVTLRECAGVFTGLINVIIVDELAAGIHPQVPPPAVDADAPMLLLSTSGTTGSAKIVQLSERNVAASTMGYLDKLRFDESAICNVRYTLCAPYCSAYGMMILSACLMRSFPLVVADEPFTLDVLYRAAEAHKITHYEGSASAILLMEQVAGRQVCYDLSTLRYFGFGGSKVAEEVIEKLYRSYPGREFFQGYGMTEAGPLITKHSQGPLAKTASVGTPIGGVRLAVDAGDGVTAEPFVRGEILAAGPNVMLGYLGDAAATARVLKGGWLYTGDIGYLDEDGHLYICGRKKNIVIVRGHNVHPEEVEECIMAGGLAAECLVYGQGDERGNEVLCADVVPAGPQVTERDIAAQCGALAPYKRPQRITLCAGIRKNAAGKAERH